MSKLRKIEEEIQVSPQELDAKTKEILETHLVHSFKTITSFKTTNITIIFEYWE